MKKIIFLSFLSFSLFSCKKEPKTKTETTVETTVETVKKPDATVVNDTFDSSKIPVSDKDLGTFPYLKAPNNYKFNSDGLQSSDISELDKEYFAVNGKLIPQEGKTAKFRLNKNGENATKFNTLIVENSFQKQILDLGGVQVNAVPIPNAEIKRVGDTELVEKHYGYSIDFNLLNQIKTYVIRTKDKEVWIQFYAMNEESGSMTVLEKSVPVPQSDSK